MTLNDLGAMQRYLVEEEAEHWQEGSISRREFIRRVTLLVGGAAAASGVLLSLGCDATQPEPTPTAAPSSPPAQATTAATTAATAAATTAATAAATTEAKASGSSNAHVDENDPTIHAEMVDIPQSVPELKLRGYLATPQGRGGLAKPGGVLVMHENRGLTPYIKDVVRRLAKAGYTALSVDLVSRAGGTDSHPDEGERIGTLGQIPTDLLLGDLQSGLDYLKSRDDVNPERLGAIGFCFGGGMTWRLITLRPEIKAAVPFYGPNPPIADVPKIKAAVLGIYGQNDARITGGVPELENALKAAGVTYGIKVYPGVGHAFHNDTGTAYNAEAANDAWGKALEWLGTHM